MREGGRDLYLQDPDSSTRFSSAIAVQEECVGIYPSNFSPDVSVVSPALSRVRLWVDSVLFFPAAIFIPGNVGAEDVFERLAVGNAVQYRSITAHITRGFSQPKSLRCSCRKGGLIWNESWGNSKHVMSAVFTALL